MLSDAWNQVTVATIQHCFAHTGIFPDEYEAILQNTPAQNLNEIVNELQIEIERIPLCQNESCLNAMDFIDLSGENELLTIDGEQTEIGDVVNDVFHKPYYYEQQYEFEIPVLAVGTEDDTEDIEENVNVEENEGVIDETY
ncbi:hypothetical protein HK096_000565 [Nowakowskiella sp. JEL0078]|nr:hypothetical protein HK096_000565 [Nowakowskiella sp. JEL0078]